MSDPYEKLILQAVEHRITARKWGYVVFTLRLTDGKVGQCRIDEKDMFRSSRQEITPYKNTWHADKIKDILGAWGNLRLSGDAVIRIYFENGVIGTIEKEDSYVLIPKHC